jgi:ribosomal protein S18 acetylase RimI-like enzyme
MDNFNQSKQNHNVKIGKAGLQDIKGIFEVQRTTWLATYVNEKYGITAEDIKMKDFFSDQRFERWTKILSEDKALSCAWIAKNNNKVIAFCAAKKELNNRISAIYVLPSFQRQGLGKILISRAIKWLGKDKDIFLDVVVYNLSAKNFYTKFGFKEISKTPITESVKLPSGKIMPEIRMIKSL